MADAPADEFKSLTDAKAALRETSKWLVGGVAAAAAGVFAGSSLTRIGTLDWGSDRLNLALLGAALGFAGLGWLMREALAVLTIEGLSLDALAAAERSIRVSDEPLSDLASQLFERYRRLLPVPASSFKEAIDKFDKLPQGSDEEKLAGDFTRTVVADASFRWVRKRFGTLTRWLPAATALSALGFGLFAWAANPPEEKPPPAPHPAFSLSISAG